MQKNSDKFVKYLMQKNSGLIDKIAKYSIDKIAKYLMRKLDLIKKNCQVLNLIDTAAEGTQVMISHLIMPIMVLCLHHSGQHPK